jgi:hypothetical protein
LGSAASAAFADAQPVHLSLLPRALVAQPVQLGLEAVSQRGWQSGGNFLLRVRSWRAVA